MAKKTFTKYPNGYIKANIDNTEKLYEDPQVEESDITIHIPEGATNGDVMQILFRGHISNGRLNTYYSRYPKWQMECKTEWWNAQYTKENPIV